MRRGLIICTCRCRLFGDDTRIACAIRRRYPTGKERERTGGQRAMREERLRRKRRRRGESRVEGLESSAVEWTASAARRERVTSIGTRRDFDDREPASESEGGSGVTLVVYSTVGWVGCIIVIVSFQLSLSPLILARLSLLKITPTLTLNLKENRQSRQRPGIATQGKSRWSSAKGRETQAAASPSTKHRVNAPRLASLVRLASL